MSDARRGRLHATAIKCQDDKNEMLSPSSKLYWVAIPILHPGSVDLDLRSFQWSLMREVQSSILRRGYIPHVTAEMQWLGVTPPAVTSGKPTGELAPRCKPRYRAVVPP